MGSPERNRSARRGSRVVASLVCLLVGCGTAPAAHEPPDTGETGGAERRAARPVETPDGTQRAHEESVRRGVSSPYEQPDIPEPLLALNGAFIDGFRRGVERSHRELGPVLQLGDGYVSLTDGDEVRREPFELPEALHLAKVYSHMPITLTMGLLERASLQDPAAGDATVHGSDAWLARFEALVRGAEAEIDALPLDAETRDLERRLVRLTLREVDRIQAGGAADRQSTADYLDEVKPLVDQNLRIAAEAYLERLHAATLRLLEPLSAGERASIRALNHGPKGPREGSLAVQYFAWLLDEGTGEGPRVVYAEGVADGDAAMGVLAKYVYERDLGRLYADDPTALQRDVMAEAVSSLLPEMDRDAAE